MTNWRSIIAAASKLNVAGPWVVDGGGTQYRRTLWPDTKVRSDAANMFRLRSGDIGWNAPWLPESGHSPSIEAAKVDADAALVAAGWTLDKGDVPRRLLGFRVRTREGYAIPGPYRSGSYIQVKHKPDPVTLPEALRIRACWLESGYSGKVVQVWQLVRT